MRKSRFRDEQMVAILREADRDPKASVAKKHGISEQTIYTWRKRFGTLQSDDVRRLKQLETENARLKKLVAERDLEIEVMKEIQPKKMVSVPARRLQIAYAAGKGLSQRRACTLIGVGRSALRYRSVKAENDTAVLARMAELSAQYPRYGYRRIAIFLGRDGHPMSFGHAHRLWRRAKLQVPRKRPRKRIATGRPRPQAPTGANQVWSYDFVFDWCANGQQLKCPTVTDEWTKEGLAIEVDGRIRSGRVIEVLSRLVSERGAPLYLRSDNGPEFVSRALLKRIVGQGIETALIDPGKPWQNGSTESFNGKFRDECLSLEWFRSRAEAQVVIETWRQHFNAVRPHSSLSYLTPAAFVARLKEQDAASVPATGRTAAVSGAVMPKACTCTTLRPVASLSRKGQSKAAARVGTSSQAWPEETGQVIATSQSVARQFRSIPESTNQTGRQMVSDVAMPLAVWIIFPRKTRAATCRSSGSKIGNFDEPPTKSICVPSRDRPITERSEMVPDLGSTGCLVRQFPWGIHNFHPEFAC